MPIEVLESPAPAKAPALPRVRRDDSALYFALVVSVSLLAAILRIHGVASKPFWMDEGMSVEYARLPWRQFAHALWSREANMALYYVALRYWLLLGHSDGFVRGLSVVFSVATVPVLYELGRRLFGRRTGLIAALILAVNAFHIRYAQEARSYAAVVLLVTLAAWLLVRNLQEPASAHWATYTAICILAVYCHFYAGFVILTQFAALAIFPGRSVSWKVMARQFAWFAGLMVPIGVFVERTGTEPISWLPPVDALGLLRFGFDMSGNYGRTLLALDIVAMAITLIYVHRLWRTNGFVIRVWGHLFLFAWLFVPVIMVLAASLVRPLFLARYFNPCLPAMVLLVSSGIAQFHPRALSWLLGGAILACSVLGTISYYHRDFDLSRQDWRAAAAYVSNHVSPGDSIFFYQGGGQPPFDFYYRWQKSPAPEWPKSLNPSFATEGSSTEFDVIPGTDLRAARPVGDRVWIIFLLPLGKNGMPDTTGVKVRDWFAAGRHRVNVLRLYPVDIVLFAKNISTPDQKITNVH